MGNAYREKGEKVKAQIVDFRSLYAVCTFLEEIKRPYSVTLESRQNRQPIVTVFIAAEEEEGTDDVLQATDADMIVLNGKTLSVIPQQKFYEKYEAIR